MTAKSTSIWAIVLGVALIVMSVYTINTYNKSAASPTSKIIVDIFAVLFILGGVGMVWTAGKVLKAA